MIWMKETSRGLEIKAKTMWSGHAGPEILGFIDGLIKISIVWESKILFFKFEDLFIYNFFKKIWRLKANILSGLAQDRP